MAGMFYSLEEVAVKLGKTEEEIRQIVKEGRLREFRDGANLLFKVDEVEALMSDTSFMAAKKEPSAPSESDIELELEPEPEPGLEPELEPEIAPELEPELAPEIAPEIEPEIEPELAAIEEEISLTPEPAEEEVSLAPESVEEDIIAESGLTDEANLTSADTALADEGTNILGETATDFQLGDDTIGKTKAASDLLAGSSGEVSLEEIEEDVNLDTFGSGSGLLDLSLQADDTSLGGILDEIYTPEGEEGKESPEGTEIELPVEPEEMLEEHEQASPQPASAAATAQAYLEPEPDTASNMLGYMMFLPLLAVIYTTIVAVASSRGVMPTIVEGIQGMIWYITGGLAVVAAIIGGAAFTMGGGGTKTAKKAKPKKAKKEKKPKKK